jgi:hypothetical protein
VDGVLVTVAVRDDVAVGVRVPDAVALAVKVIVRMSTGDGVGVAVGVPVEAEGWMEVTVGVAEDVASGTAALSTIPFPPA